MEISSDEDDFTGATKGPLPDSDSGVAGTSSEPTLEQAIKMSSLDEPLDDAEERLAPVDAGQLWSGGVDEDGLPAGLPVSGQDIRDGFNLFFRNRHTDAMDFFAQYKDAIPVFAIGFGTLSVMKAIMTFEQDDADRAMAELRAAEGLAAAAAKPEGAMSSIARFLTGTKKAELTPEQIHATVISGEARLLIGQLHFMQESVMGFVKGGYSVRQAWKIFERIFNLYRDPKTRPRLDRETAGAVEFSVGAFNLVNSILPTKLRKLVAFFGFPTDRILALRLLNQCHDGGGLRARVAAALLLMYHVVLQSFFSFNAAAHIAEADRILKVNLELFPDGGLFIYLDGRLKRLKRDLPGALKQFLHAEELQREFVQLQHLCYYELGWTNLYSLDWAASEDYFARLLKDNEWSKATYGYLLAACVHAQGDTARAQKLFSEAPGYVTRKWGGKTISSEQFVLRKVALFNANAMACTVPHIELIYLWNGFSQMPEALLERTLELMVPLVAPDHPTADLEIRYVHLLIHAALLKELGRSKEAVTSLSKIIVAKKRIREERYTVPFAYYELSQVHLNAQSDSLALKSLAKARGYSEDYNFEMRLKMRIHLASDYFRLRGLTVNDEDEQS